jgi:hypothetical protein
MMDRMIDFAITAKLLSRRKIYDAYHMLRKRSQSCLVMTITTPPGTSPFAVSHITTRKRTLDFVLLAPSDIIMMIRLW